MFFKLIFITSFSAKNDGQSSKSGQKHQCQNKNAHCGESWHWDGERWGPTFKSEDYWGASNDTTGALWTTAGWKLQMQQMQEIIQVIGASEEASWSKPSAKRCHKLQMRDLHGCIQHSETVN